jgi:hypothetical protein
MDIHVKNFIEEKGGILTIELVNGQLSCCNGPIELVALPVKPKNPNHFYEVKIDNITIFVQKGITPKEELTLQRSGFGRFKWIRVDGLKIF